MPSSSRVAAILTLLALPLAPLPAASFAVSRAPVADDPGIAPKQTAHLWPHINLTEARRLWGRHGVVFVDGRSRAEWEYSRIPGAVCLPGAEFENAFPPLRHRLIHAQAVICYCHGFTCGESDYICRLLAGQGLRNMAVFSGGYPQWRGAGYPLAGRSVAKQKAHPKK